MRVGFGIPTNSGGPYHWWTSDNKPACEPKSIYGFNGSRVGVNSIKAGDVCVDCLIILEQVFGKGKIPKQPLEYD